MPNEKYLFITIKNHLPLARAEIENLFRIEDEEDNLFLIDNVEMDVTEIFDRLAYTNFVNKIIFSASTLEELKNEIKNINKTEFDIQGSFMIRSKIDLDIKEFANLIWNQSNKPEVNLKNPDNIIEIVKFKEKYLLTHRIWGNNKEFFNRKPHMRPSLHPTSLDPRLARACVNIIAKNQSQTKQRTQTILDPFCGSGGFLIEAGLMGINSIGFDLDGKMLERTKTNLSFYKIKEDKYKLFKKDATDIDSYNSYNLRLNVEFDAIISDLPYGRASKLHNKEVLDLYQSFFKTIKEIKQVKNKKLRVLLILPDFVDEKIISKHFSIYLKYNYYIHRSLSRVVYVLD